jgi:hypothetical protein
MRDGKIPTLRYLSQMSDVNFSKNYDLEKEDYISISHNVYDYYESISEGPTPLKYKLRKNGEVSTVKSALGVFEGGIPDINRINKVERNLSEFDLDIIDGLDIYVSDTWNGSQVDVKYDNGELYVGESDYYTTIGYMKLLAIEILENYNNGKLSIRNEYLRTEEDFKNPTRPVGATTGGVIIANTGDKWNLIIGSRSEKASVNSGLYSIFPNGGVLYDNVDDEKFEPTLNKTFVDEIFDDRPKGSIFHNKNVRNLLLTKAWNLRHGDFVTGYALIINSPVSYDVLMNSAEYNGEINNIVEVPIDDYSMIKNILSMNNTTASVIPTIAECLKKFGENDQYPDVPYTIEREF